MKASRVRDLMTSQVLYADADMSLPELATFLSDHEITGAAVEDSDGDLVGVVSATDLVVATAGGEMLAPSPSGRGFYVRGWEEELDAEDLEDLHLVPEGMKVKDLMTPEIYSVEAGSPVSEAARIMLKSHVHRLLVMEDGLPVGILSTSDLLSALVKMGTESG